MNSFPTIQVILGLFLPFSCSGRSEAQEKSPRRILRLLALGETPPFRIQQVDGANVEMSAPEGTVPPLKVAPRSEPGEEFGEAVRLRLNQFSEPIPADGDSVALHELGAGGVKKTPWHTITMPPEATHALALLWRDPDEAAWSKARSITLADDFRAFWAGMIRFANLSPWSVEIKLGEEEFELGAGQLALRGQARVAYSQGPLEIKLQGEDGKLSRILSTAFTQEPEERTNVIIYVADGTKPRAPAKVRLLRERAELVQLPR